MTPKVFESQFRNGTHVLRGLKASIAAARYVSNGRDIPRKKAIRSLDIKAQGENGTI